MSVSFTVGLEYTKGQHNGFEVAPTTSKYVIYTDAGGFQWNTLSCTEAEAIAKQQSPSMNPIVAELKFIPKP